MLTPVNIGIAVIMAAGTMGIVVPVLPGLFIVWAASGAWALLEQSTAGWVMLGLTTAAFLGGVTAQYLIPGRRMRTAGIARRHLALAILAGVIGFFVIPVVGAPVFFVLTVYLLEHRLHRDPVRARAATKQAVSAVLTNIGIELLTAFAIILIWATTVVLTRP